MVSIFLWHLGYLQESTWMFVLFFALLLALWIIWWLQWFFAGTSLDADRWVAGVIEFDGGREDNHDKPCIDIVYVYVFNCLYIYISLNPEVFIELLIGIGIVFFSNQLQLGTWPSWPFKG